MKKVLYTSLIAFFSALLATLACFQWMPDRTIVHQIEYNTPSKKTASTNTNNASPAFDFKRAAEKAMPAVVHITTVQAALKEWPQHRSSSSSITDILGGVSGRRKVGHEPAFSNASGVIISSDGYIVTNFHVVNNVEHVEVILYNKQSYQAKIVGTDAATDLALLKISKTNLPYVQFSNSDEVSIGEWVLAVGNPFNLASTVTAGIVSAKGRDINILHGDYAIESFIQTDAMVNEGNSGGALVNTTGELIGVNTAIATSTGFYQGYSFAVPSNIVKKVVDDLRLYGKVQRAYLGVETQDISKNTAESLRLKSRLGAYVTEVSEDGAAHVAGLQKGDVIIELGGFVVSGSSELSERMARFSPGDQVPIVYIRDGKEVFVEAKLKNINNTTKIIKDSHLEMSELLGAQFQELTKADLMAYGVGNGVKVAYLSSGLLQDNTPIKVGFIILRVNNKPVNSISELFSNIAEVDDGDGLMIEGMYPGDFKTSLYVTSLK